jgi:molecular chaperone DnaJ
MRYNLELSLEEAVRGATVNIRIPTRVKCKVCTGTGAKPGTTVNICPTCQGHGQVRMQQGFFSVQQTCPRCRGRGKMITDPCAGCKGQGMVQDQQTLSVKIPEGVNTGDRIRVSGKGEESEGTGPAGDLYVQINVREHAIFAREENDLFCEVPITFVMAAGGGELDVPTLTGHVKLQIPLETQTGKVFRLRGKGVKSLRGSKTGDLLCKVTVETPVNLTSQQKKLLKDFEQSLSEGGGKHSPKASSWLDSVRKFFDSIQM